MEKEKLSSDLRSAVGTTSMSDQSWNAYIDQVAFPYFPEDETKQADYLAKHVAYLKTQSGQYNKDIADRVKEAEKGLAATQTVEAATEGDMPQWAKEMQKKFEALETEKIKHENTAKINQLISNVTSKVEAQGADNKHLLDLVVSSIEFDTHVSEDEYIKQVKTSYDQAYQNFYGSGARPSYGGGGSGSIKASAEAQKIREKIVNERKNLRV